MSYERESGSSVQESLEKTARISRIVFDAPPTLPTYAGILLLSLVSGLLIRRSPSWESAVVDGILLFGLPAIVSGLVSAPWARVLGGTLYPRRSAFLSAVGTALSASVLLLTLPLRSFLGLSDLEALILALSFPIPLRHVFLFATSDNRHGRTLGLSLLPLGLSLFPALELFPWRAREAFLFVFLPLALLGPTIFFLHVFDAPFRRNFRVSASELFRHYLDHISTGRLEGEPLLRRFAEPIRARFSLVAFRRRDGTLKAVVVVPALHPGPVGRLGGSDLPGKIASHLPGADVVLVPHGPATHDFNPVSASDMERLGRAVSESVPSLVYTRGGSPLVEWGEGVRVSCQILGEVAFLTYTSWPHPIDDVDYGVGLAAELSSVRAGALEAIFVDCHNSLLPGAGGVFLCTERSDRILEGAYQSTLEALSKRVQEIRVGAAKDTTSFGRSELVGDQGVQVLVVEAGGKTAAYVLWDGNNALPIVTQKIQEALLGIVDRVQVLTTDNHSVNAVAGSFGPLGLRSDPEKIAQVTRKVVERALSNLEPVEVGHTRSVLEEFYVFGHQKTVQLTSSINVVASLLPELVGAWIASEILSVLATFYLASFWG